MNARPTARPRSIARRRWVGFPTWLAAQASRSDDIGRLGQELRATGQIDRTNLELLHKAIAEWASDY